MRGFEIVKREEFLKLRPSEDYENISIPKRATTTSAGYDFYLAYDIAIEKHSSIVIASGIKAYMNDDEVLLLFVRSSLGFKGIRLKNQVGVIDSDYYNNDNNEGHILIAVENTSDEAIVLNKGSRVIQGVFVKYLISENEEKSNEIRRGGIGSTRK